MPAASIAFSSSPNGFGFCGAGKLCSCATLLKVTSSSSAVSIFEAVFLRSALTVSRRRIWSSEPV